MRSHSYGGGWALHAAVESDMVLGFGCQTASSMRVRGARLVHDGAGGGFSFRYVMHGGQALHNTGIKRQAALRSAYKMQTVPHGRQMYHRVL